MASKKTRLVLSVSYCGKDGVIPAGQEVELSAAEASEFLAQGLGREPGSGLPPAPATVSGAEAETLRCRVTALEAELAATRADCETRLAEARDYALGLEDRLREAGLLEEPKQDAGK